MSTLEHIDLPISGMTCASCANRVERSLNQLDGVTASVNYATEQAAIDFDGDHVHVPDLIAAVEKTGYGAALPAASGDPLRMRLRLSIVLALPTLALSMVPALQFDAWQWVALALATPVVTWGAWPFHRAAARNARHASATMDTLISVGVLASWLWSLYALLLGSAGEIGMKMSMELLPAGSSGADHIYLEVGAAVTVFMLAGRTFEARAKRNAGAALTQLLELGARDVSVLINGHEQLLPIEQLAVGQEFVVRPGEKIATDGVVVSGESAVDQSLVTGESVPVDRTVGDEVVGASISTNGRIVVRATRVGNDTMLAGIARLVTQAQTGKAAVQRLADRISAVFVPVVIALAVATAGFWLGAGADVSAAFAAAVAVLIIACPCALGLATPTALLVGTGRGAQLGLLIKGPEVLESTRRIDTVVLDKTGTITSGTMTLAEVTVASGVDRDDALHRAGALEQASEHPVARAIVRAAQATDSPFPSVESFANHAGHGVSGSIDGGLVLVGREQLLATHQMEIGAELADALDAARQTGATAVLVAWDGAARAVLSVTDTVKPTSAAAIAELRALGLRPVLLTGDHAAAAQTVARQVGIDDVIANVLPADKAAEIRRLQGEGRAVAMVGDGVNDAPALAQADLGIAIGTGADVAIEASDLTLMSGDLGAAPDAIRLARATLRTIRQNLTWAFAYNVAALPLAAAGVLNPVIAGLAMALSSVSVVGNSLRLRRFSR